MGPVVIVSPEIHPLFPFKRCDYTATMCTHTPAHARLAALIQFRRLEERDKEMEGGERGSEGGRRRRKEARSERSLSLSFVILSVPYADEELI